MKFQRKLFYLIVSVVLIFAITACGGSNNGNTNTNTGTNTNGNAANGQDQSNGIEPMTIRISTSVAEDHSMHLGAVKIKEVIEEKTNGVVTVELFSGQQLGSLRETAEAVQLGSLEMTTNTVSTFAGFTDVLKVMEYPYLWPTDTDKLWEVVNGEAGQQLLDAMSANGFKALGFWGGGFKAITNTGDPILSPEDLDGVSMRVIPSETLISQYEAWGANPTPVDFGELYSALQQGTVDAQENPLETIVSMKFHEVQDSLTVLNHGYQFYAAAANKAWFDGLSPEMQEIVIEAELAGREHSRQLNEQKNAETLALFEEAGLDINILTDEQIQKFVELSLPLHDELSDTQEKKDMLKVIKDEIEKLQ